MITSANCTVVGNICGRVCWNTVTEGVSWAMKTSFNTFKMCFVFLIHIP